MTKMIIRKHYETNSSSSHSFTTDVDEFNIFFPNWENKCHFLSGDFGWEDDLITDAFTKLCYLSYDRHNPLFQQLIEFVKGKFNCTFTFGEVSIDHESTGNPSQIMYHFNTVEQLVLFVFNTNCAIITTNDNGGYYFNLLSNKPFKNVAHINSYVSEYYSVLHILLSNPENLFVCATKYGSSDYYIVTPTNSYEVEVKVNKLTFGNVQVINCTNFGPWGIKYALEDESFKIEKVNDWSSILIYDEGRTRHFVYNVDIERTKNDLS